MLVAAAARSSLTRSVTAGAAAAATLRRGFSTAKADGIPIAASSDDGSRTSIVTVAIKAGPRYENSPGEAHVLKNFTFKSTAERSALALIREAELYGGVLSSTLTKEHLLLTAEFLRGDEDYFVGILGEAVSSPRFAEHEYKEEVIPSVQSEYEQSLTQANILGFDQLTQTAYRQRGLGASIFAAPSSPVSYKSIVQFGTDAFAKDNISVVGSGIDSSTLTKLVSKNFRNLKSSKGSLQQGSKKYFGGDNRYSFAAQHSEGQRAHYGHYFLAFEGAGVDASPELAVLAAHLGGSSNVKWCAGQSPFSQIAEKVAGSQVTAFNINFTDSGLIGAYITAPHAHIQQAAKATAQAFKEASKSLSKEALEKAKAKAQFEAASAIESRLGVHSAIAGQLLEGKNVQLMDEVLSKIQGVSASNLASAASKALSSKPTTVALGDVHQLPYADEIM